MICFAHDVTVKPPIGDRRCRRNVAAAWLDDGMDFGQPFRDMDADGMISSPSLLLTSSLHLHVSLERHEAPPLIHPTRTPPVLQRALPEAKRSLSVLLRQRPDSLCLDADRT